MNELTTYKKENEVLKIYYDDVAESPREWDNFSIMAIKCKNYNLSDNLDFEIPQNINFEEFEEYLINEQNAIITIPLWLYNHSGICLTTSQTCRWDSSPIGYAFVTEKMIKDNWNIEEVTEEYLQKARELIKAEIETYNKYLSGEVYYFELCEIEKCKCCNHEEEKMKDSCCGFYDVDDIFEHLGLNKEEWNEV